MRISGGGAAAPRQNVQKKKAPTPKATKPVPAKKSLPGYKVPKKLTKSTPSNRLAGGGTSPKQTFSDMKKMEAKKYAADQKSRAAAAKKKPAVKKAATPTKSGDWQLGKEWMNKQKPKVRRIPGRA